MSKHGMTGKRNAVKKKASHVSAARVGVTMTTAQKLLYEKAAHRSGMSLNAWIRHHLDAVAAVHDNK